MSTRLTEMQPMVLHIPCLPRCFHCIQLFIPHMGSTRPVPSRTLPLLVARLLPPLLPLQTSMAKALTRRRTATAHLLKRGPLVGQKPARMGKRRKARTAVATLLLMSQMATRTRLLAHRGLQMGMHPHLQQEAASRMEPSIGTSCRLSDGSLWLLPPCRCL